MKKIIIILFLVFTSSFSIHAENMQKYLKDTRAMAQEGKYKEALDRFIWFHDHALEYQPSMYGVRLSFALSYWKQLGELYPPALEAMKKIRDEKTEIVAEGKGNRELFTDVAALNRTLCDSNKTVELFRKLDQNQPELSKRCWSTAEKDIIKYSVYDLARKYTGNFTGEWSTIKKNYERRKNYFVERTISMIDAALASGDKKATEEIKAGALAILNDSRLADIISGENESSSNWEILTPTHRKKVYRGLMISMVYNGVPLPFMLKYISDVSGLKIALQSDLRGKVTIYTNNIPWAQSLDMVLEQNGLYFEMENDVIRILPKNKSSNGENTECNESILWIGVRDTNVLSVLDYIKKNANVEFSIDDDVSGKVTANLKNVSWEQALAVVLDLSNLRSERQEQDIRILSAAQ